MKKQWKIFTSLVVLIASDIAALASAGQALAPEEVSQTVSYSFYFSPIAVVDLISELILLVNHDLKICNAKPIKQKSTKFALFLEILVTLAWVAVLIFLITTITRSDCKDVCKGCITMDGKNVTGPCNFKGYNSTILVDVDGTDHIVNKTSCYDFVPARICSLQTPGFIEVVVIIFIIFKSLYALRTAWKRYNVYPITFHEEILFLSLIKQNKESQIVDCVKTALGLQKKGDKRQTAELTIDTSKTPDT